jgi:hypothetical protein
MGTMAFAFSSAVLCVTASIVAVQTAKSIDNCVTRCAPPWRWRQRRTGSPSPSSPPRCNALTGVDHCGYTVRPADYDLRKLRGKQLVGKPGRTRRYHVGAPAARTIAALLTLRDQVIAPILAAVRSPRMGRKPAHWTRVDRDYERIRIDMQTLFNDLAIEVPLAA